MCFWRQLLFKVFKGAKSWCYVPNLSISLFTCDSWRSSYSSFTQIAEELEMLTVSVKFTVYVSALSRPYRKLWSLAVPWSNDIHWSDSLSHVVPSNIGNKGSEEDCKPANMEVNKAGLKTWKMHSTHFVRPDGSGSAFSVFGNILHVL